MALVHISQTLSTSIYPLIEDPNTATNRLFLSAIGHDATYLTPQFGSYYHRNDNSLLANALTAGVGNAANYTGAFRLNGNSISTQAISESATGSNKDVHAAYHRSLDPLNYPAKLNWFSTFTNRSIITFTGTEGAAGTNNMVYNIHGSDITQGYLYIGNVASTTANMPNNFFYEDTTNGVLWGTINNCPPANGVVRVTNYNNIATGPIFTNATGPATQQTTYFMGVDANTNTYWVTVLNNTASEPYQLYRFSYAGTASTLTTSTSLSSYAPSATTYFNLRPSNLRTDSPTKKVFYSSHFDLNGYLAPVRFMWDSTNLLGTGASVPPPVTTSTCTMVYGATVGVGSYTFYAAKFANTGVGTNNADSWAVQPQQFQPTGTSTWYLTYWLIDKANTTANALTRWSTARQRTMMTYVIGNTATNFDNTLTFHSSYTFADAYNMPRDWLPITLDGTQVVAPTYQKTMFMQFSTTSGWYISSIYPYQFETCGLDAQGRLWGVGREVANYSLHLITPTLPTQVSVNMPSQSYTYTGTNIATTASLYAYNSAGNLITATVYLSINGNSMLFTDNGTTAQTYTTSALTGTNVNLTITGAGVSTVVVGAAI